MHGKNDEPGMKWLFDAHQNASRISFTDDR
jgi:hypothetical protein